MKELRGKVAVVTGASRGIGRRIALAFAGSGAKLVLASRNKYGDLDEVAKEMGSRSAMTTSSLSWLPLTRNSPRGSTK